MKTIMVIDDEPSVRYSLSTVFEKDDRVITAESGEEALEKLTVHTVDVAIVDLMMPGMSGLELIPRLRQTEPRLAVVVLTALEDVDKVVEAVKGGASQYLTKPFDVNEVKLAVRMAIREKTKESEISALEKDVARWYDPYEVVGQAPAWNKTLQLAGRAANARDTTIMLYGESGTGKELLARYVHSRSPRAADPFVPIHCAAIPEQLLESELFGYEKGSFTGADKTKEGCIETADGGTLFLDEIGEMPQSMQSKLLRFLQDHQFMRIGGRQNRHADVRVVGATNKDLQQGVNEGWFREDLYYRLNVIPVTIPPLRERKEDIQLLADHFLKQFRTEHNVELNSFSSEAVELLQNYYWPGNVRELRNLIERLVVLHGNESVIQPAHLPPEINGDTDKAGKSETGRQELPVNLEKTVGDLEKKLICRAVEEAEGNLSQAALLLHTTRRRLKYKIDQYAIEC